MKTIKMDSVDLLSFALDRASDDAIREVISVIDQKFGELYDESEQLEKLDPEQRVRARYLNEMLDVMTALMDCCYDAIEHEEDADE